MTDCIMVRVLEDIKVAIEEKPFKPRYMRKRDAFALFMKSPIVKLRDLSERLAHVEAEFQVCVYTRAGL
jgi:hypothetical protein